MASLIVLEGHSSKTLIDLEKRVRDVSINRTSQNVFDFIEINGLSCAQVIEIIEH